MGKKTVESIENKLGISFIDRAPGSDVGFSNSAALARYLVSEVESSGETVSKYLYLCGEEHMDTVERILTEANIQVY